MRRIDVAGRRAVTTLLMIVVLTPIVPTQETSDRSGPADGEPLGVFHYLDVELHRGVGDEEWQIDSNYLYFNMIYPSGFGWSMYLFRTADAPAYGLDVYNSSRAWYFLPVGLTYTPFDPLEVRLGVPIRVYPHLFLEVYLHTWVEHDATFRAADKNGLYVPDFFAGLTVPVYVGYYANVRFRAGYSLPGGLRYSLGFGLGGMMTEE